MNILEAFQSSDCKMLPIDMLSLSTLHCKCIQCNFNIFYMCPTFHCNLTVQWNKCKADLQVFFTLTSTLDCIWQIQSNLVIRNFLVILELFLNAKSSLSLWSQLVIGHGNWFLRTSLFIIKTFLITKFDCTCKVYTFHICAVSTVISLYIFAVWKNLE